MGVDELDTLYFHGSMREVAKAVAAFTTAYDLTKRGLYAKVLEDFKSGVVPDINPDLYEAYSGNLRKAVADVLQSGDYGDRYFDMQMQFEANVSRFAAYKAWHATRELSELEPDELDTVGRAKLNKYNRWQATEYNTAMARTRTAKQFTDFTSDPKANLLYPNLKWLPSRSANPREEHRVFWNRVWAKDDPFWNENSPGSLWNCKCDWRETDEPVTDGNPGGHISHRGLEGNPAKTGEVFTDECPYVRNAERNVEKESRKVSRDSIRQNKTNNSLIGKKAECTINGEKFDVHFQKIGIHEYAQSMIFSNDFWIKNAILQNIDKYIENSTYIKTLPVDLNHNKGKTLKFKKKLSCFHYLESILPNGNKFCIHIAEYKDGLKILYTATSQVP